MKERLKFNLTKLAEEILDQIPETLFVSSTTTFLDPAMGGGQFLKAVISRLRKYGHSDENISNRVFGYESNKMRVNFAKKQCDYIGVFEAKNFLEEDMSKKFDVIVGNPPYQSGKGNGSHPIYKDFFEKAMELSVDNGIVAMITPPGHLSGGNLENPTKLYDKIKKGNLLRIQYDNVADHFPGIGSLFSYTVWQNSEYQKSTQINNECVDISSLNFIPPKFSKKRWNIIQKLITKGTPLDTTYRKEVDSTKWVVAFKELNHISNKQGNIRPTIFKPGEYTTNWNYAKTCETATEAKHVETFLNSKVSSYYNFITRHNGVIHNGIIKHLCVPSLDCKSEEDFQKFFELSDDEVNEINCTIR